MKSKSELLKEIKNLLLNSGYVSKATFDRLVEHGYFKAPAGNHHHTYEGGLAQHSFEVYEIMVLINEVLELGLEHSDIVITALFHDLDKIGYYEPNVLKSGKVSESRPYKFNPSIILSHGCGSIYLLNNLFKLEKELTPSQATAIEFHTGLYNKEFDKWGVFIDKDEYTFKLWYCLFISDLWSSRKDNFQRLENELGRT